MSSPRGDDFTRRKLAWLDQVAGDRSVPDGAFRLAYIIASRFLNRKTGDAFPSQTTLGDAVGVTTAKGVKYFVDHLVRYGHLEVIEAHGRGLTNRYRPILKSRPSKGSGGAKPDTSEQTLFPELDRAGVELGRTDQFATDFEAWWQQYPRKVDKIAARKAYMRAREAGNAAAVILAGAIRYGAERDGQDPKYTKHAATWLNRQCWNDEPLPGGHRREGDRAHTALAPSHLEIAIGGLDRG